jgi:hypothetical protein
MKRYPTKTKIFSQILGILKDTLKPKLIKNKRYNALAFLIRLYGREVRTLRKKDKKTTEVNRD